MNNPCNLFHHIIIAAHADVLSVHCHMKGYKIHININRNEVITLTEQNCLHMQNMDIISVNDKSFITPLLHQ